METRENVVTAKSAKRTHSSGMRYLGKNREFMYSLQDRIGQGQFGTVYKGVQTSTQKTVAVKLFRITEPVNLLNDHLQEKRRKEEEKVKEEEEQRRHDEIEQQDQNEKHLRLMRMQQRAEKHKRREKTSNDKQMQRLPHEVSTLWKLRDFGCPNILHIYSAWYKQKVIEKHIPSLSSTTTSPVQSKEQEQQEQHHLQSPVHTDSPTPKTKNNNINNKSENTKTCSPGEMKSNQSETCTYQTELHYIIVTEYCAGSDLQHRLLEHGKVDEVIARTLIYQLANALHFLKRQRIIHRDIKPANILLTSRNMAKAVLKIADFGMAKVAPTIINPPLPISSSSSQSSLTNLEKEREESPLSFPEHSHSEEQKCKVTNANTRDNINNDEDDKKNMCNVCNKTIQENNKDAVDINDNDDITTYDDDDDDDDDDGDIDDDDSNDEEDDKKNRRKGNRLPSKICNACNKVPCYSTLFESELGTPLYMSPERIHGQPYGFKADVYSAGMILYELMTGHPVKVRNMQELKHKVPRAMDALVRQYGVRNSLPTNYIYEEHSKCAIPMWLDLLRKMTAGNPIDRLNIEDVLRHPWFHSDTGLPVLPELTCALPPLVSTTRTAAILENINIDSNKVCQTNNNSSNSDNNKDDNITTDTTDYSNAVDNNTINKCNEVETQNEQTKLRENDEQSDLINKNNINSAIVNSNISDNKKEHEIAISELSESLSLTCNSFIVTEATWLYIHCIYHEMIKNETDIVKQLVLVHYVCQLLHKGYTLFKECERQRLLQIKEEEIIIIELNDETNFDIVHNMRDCNEEGVNIKNNSAKDNSNKGASNVDVSSTEQQEELPLCNSKTESKLPVVNADEMIAKQNEIQTKMHYEEEELTLIAVWRQLFKEVTEMWTSLQLCCNNNKEIQETTSLDQKSQKEVNETTEKSKNRCAEQLSSLWPRPKLAMIGNTDINVQIDGAEQLILHKALTLIEHATLTTASLVTTAVVKNNNDDNILNVESASTSQSQNAKMTLELTNNTSININKDKGSSENSRNDDDRTVELNKQYADALFTFQRALTLLRVLAQHVVISWSDIIDYCNNSSKSHKKENYSVRANELLNATCNTRQHENAEFDENVKDTSDVGKDTLFNLQTRKSGENLINNISEQELMCLLHIPLVHSLSERDNSTIEHLINEITPHVTQLASRTERKKNFK